MVSATEQPEYVEAYVFFIFQVLVVGTLLYLAREEAKRAANKDQDELADIRRVNTRGSTIPMAIGRFRSTGFFVWRQDGPPIAVSGGGSGKFGFSVDPNTEVTYREYASQVIANTEGRVLYRIRDDGQTIFEGPITPFSHPSGSLLECTDGSSFRIYWGERDQPFSQGGRDQHFGDAPNTDFLTGVRLQTRLPGAIRIDWQWKELGPSRVWSRVDYEFAGSVVSGLSESPSIVPGAWDNLDILTAEELEAARPDIASVFAGGGIMNGERALAATEEVSFRVIEGQGGGQNDPTRFVRISSGIVVSGGGVGPGTRPALVSLFPPGAIVRIDDGVFNGAARGSLISAANGGAKVDLEDFSRLPNAIDTHRYFFVDRAEYDPARLTFGGFGGQTLQGSVLLYLGPEVNLELTPSLKPILSPAADRVMRAVPVTEVDEPGGVNGGHMLYQVMFAKWPSGAGLEQTFFDLDSLERVSRALGPLGDAYRGSITMAGSESYGALAQALVDDLGVIIPFDPETGLYRFELLRELKQDQVNNLPFVPTDATTKSDPGVRSLIAKTGTVQSYVFSDIRRNYQDLPIVISSDGSRRIESRSDLRKERIISTGLLGSAVDAAQRRSRKSFSTISRVEIFATREARMLRPGMRFVHEQFDRVLMVVSTKRDPMTDTVHLKCGFDSFGGDVSRVSPVERLALRQGVDGSARVGQGSPGLSNFRIWELPVQLTPGTAMVVTLAEKPAQTTVAAVSLLSGDGGNVFLEGSRSPSFQPVALLNGAITTASNPVLDFSQTVGGDEEVLDLSNEPLDFQSGLQVLLIDDEILFWDGVSSFLRGRYGSTPAAHSDGARVWVIRMDRVTKWGHPLIQPGRTLQFKALAAASGGRTIVDASLVTAQSLTIVGTGLDRSAPADDAADINVTLKARGLIE